MLSIAVVLFSLLAPAPARAAGRLYVKPGGGGNGSSWASPMDLAAALASATSGTDIWVAKGTYKPTDVGTASTFLLKDGVAIYGGFAGNETTIEARNWTTNVVILSGERGAPGKADDCYHVVTGANGATLDGVTISGGNADSSNSLAGGGMYNEDSSPTLSNIIFSGNAAIYGGGMYNENSSPLLTNVTFSANSAAEGGGMYNKLSNPLLTNVTFSANSVQTMPGEARGGGMYNDESSPALNNVTFSANHASDLGGGMYNENGSSPTLTNVTFSGNSASSGGGMANRYGGDEHAPMLISVTFSSNSATNGGAIYNQSSATALYNVRISGNTATGSGGGIWSGGSNGLILRNASISGNSAASGGGIYNDNDLSFDPMVIENSIVWGNTATSAPAIYNLDADFAMPEISHSLVQGSGGSDAWNADIGDDMGDNLDVDPQFVVPVPSAPSNAGNLRLREASLAINAGDNSVIPDPAADLDLDGMPRVVDTTVDMGAYERQPAGVRYVNYAATGSGTGYSWADAITTLPVALAFAGSGDELWVAKGTYTPGASRSDSFQLRAGAAVYGGFAGTESTRDARSTTTNVVTLSGDIGTVGNNTDNVYHVVTGAAGATLDGVTITKGNANLAPDDKGGGIYNPAENLILSNLIITSNSADYGGGIYNDAGSMALDGITISSNSASSNGGGIYNATGDATLSSVTIGSNSAANGGGIYNYYSAPTLTSLTLSSNSASASGGGMYNDNSDPTLSGVILSGNSAGSGGAGMYNSASSPALRNMTISGNKVTAGSGGGLSNSASSPTLQHVTISGNSASVSGGGMYNSSSNPSISNSIIWGNLAGSNTAISNSASVPVIRNSLVQGSGGSGAWGSAFGTNAGGNLDTDPLFTIAVPTAPSTGGNLRLQATSLAINAGLNSLLPVDLTSDLAGNPRIIGGTVDMGAYEVQNPALRSITRAGATNPTNATSVSFNLNFTMPVANLDADDLVLTTTGGQSGATIGALSSSGSTWTVAVNTVDSQVGTIRLDLRGNNGIVSSDAPQMAISGPGSSGFTTGESYALDRVLPQTTISSSPTSPNKNTSATFSFGGSDSNTGVKSFECQIDGGGFSACTSPHTLNGLGHASHTFQVRAIDNAANVDASPASYTWTVDTVLPSVSVGAPSSSLTRGGPVSFVVTYSDDQMGAISLKASDITLSRTGTATGTLSVSGSGTGSRTVTISAISGDGTLAISLGAGTATDAAGNSALAPDSPSTSVSVDNTRPTLTMSSAVADPTNVSSIPVTVVFSEDVTSFSADDITLGNAEISDGSFSGSGKDYSFTLTPLGNGEVTAVIAAGLSTDAAGNLNMAAATFSRVYDDSPLAMSISSTTAEYTNNSPILVSIRFGKPVDPAQDDFTLDDLSITAGGADIGNLSGSGTSYSFEITPKAEGVPITVQVADAAAKDAAGNPSTTHSITRIYDGHAPSGQSLVASSPPAQDTTSYQFTVVLSDNVGLDLASLGNGDVTVMTPRGNSITASFVSYVEQPDKTVRATFRILAPGGTWESDDNGKYTVKLAASALYDKAGNVAAAKDLGTFTAALKYKVLLPLVVRG